MRLVEVVMLMGAHCVSPVEHGQLMTEAAKVQCAVVIEKDTDAGTVTVTPPESRVNPQVMAALERMGPVATDAPHPATVIVPAWAPAGSPTTEIKPPVAKATVPAALAEAPDVSVPSRAEAVDSAKETPATKPAPAADTRVATLAPPPQKPSPAKAPVAKKPATATRVAAKAPLKCEAPNVLKWYRKNGTRKYHCVEPASDSAPGQLY